MYNNGAGWMSESCFSRKVSLNNNLSSIVGRVRSKCFYIMFVSSTGAAAYE